MPRFNGYDAAAEIGLIADGLEPAAPFKGGEYRAYPVRNGASWVARVHVERDQPAGSTLQVLLELRPPGDVNAQFYPGMEFEIRDEERVIARGRITRCWFGYADGFGVRTLTRATFLAEAMPKLLQVCRVRNEPYEGNLEGTSEPFLLTVPERGILAWPFYFTAEHCRAFATAARAIGDSGLYLWIHEAGLDDDAFESFPSCYFPLATAEDAEEFIRYYDANEAFIGVTLFSATGRWAAITYGGADYAVFGGPTTFITTVYDALGTSAEEQALEFLRGFEGRQWTQDPDRWKSVPELLVHVYGQEQASRFIAEAKRRASEPPPL